MCSLSFSINTENLSWFSSKAVWWFSFVRGQGFNFLCLISLSYISIPHKKGNRIWTKDYMFIDARFDVFLINPFTAWVFDRVLWGNSNFWVCGRNPMMWPFKWKLSACTFTWCYLFVKILENEIWKFGRNLPLATFDLTVKGLTALAMTLTFFSLPRSCIWRPGVLCSFPFNSDSNS